jgi:hypothetical protein
VIPRCGYRIEDSVDDYVNHEANPSAEGFRAAHEHDPSAEVREPAAIYRIAHRYGGALAALR